MMKREPLLDKKFFAARHLDLVVGVPVIFMGLVVALGIYSVKVYLAMQAYFGTVTAFVFSVPPGVFFYYDRYINVILAAVVISVIAGVVISYSISKALSK